MSARRSLADLLDVAPLVRASRFRLGGLRTRGVPAILCGAAAIVFAAGAGDALRKLAAVVPDALREARLLLATIRADRSEYLPKDARRTM